MYEKYKKEDEILEMFNAENEVNNIIKFIKRYYQENNLSKAILGISGGKDSAVVAALLVKALGRENVVGVTVSCHSKKEDRIDAKIVSDYYNFKLINFDITNIFDNFKNELNNLGKFTKDDIKNSDLLGDEVKKKIKKLHDNNLHKFNIPTYRR